ncbi:MAG: hypothetical protein GYB65_01885 [Chloroflexi bacterium]|nr:hypothetical protein [Chloroflexota bacterium]
MIQIQFLWWAGCPSHPEAWQRLQTVLQDMDVDALIESVEIKTEADAAQWRFPGSPTIRVNEVDIDPGAPQTYRLTCRLYFREDGRPSPLPSEETIRRAILHARRNST